MNENLETTLLNADPKREYVIGEVTLPTTLRAKELVQQMIYPGQEVTIMDRQPHRHMSKIQVGVEGVYLMGDYLTQHIRVRPAYDTKVMFK